MVLSEAQQERLADGPQALELLRLAAEQEEPWVHWDGAARPGVALSVAQAKREAEEE